MEISATIFSLLSFTKQYPTATSVSSTFLILTIIDCISRYRISLLCILGMIFGLLLSAFAFYHLRLPTHPSPPYNLATLHYHCPGLSIFIYVSSYALGNRRKSG